jgi:hypothetical protein
VGAQSVVLQHASHEGVHQHNARPGTSDQSATSLACTSPTHSQYITTPVGSSLQHPTNPRLKHTTHICIMAVTTALDHLINTRVVPNAEKKRDTWCHHPNRCTGLWCPCCQTAAGLTDPIQSIHVNVLYYWLVATPKKRIGRICLHQCASPASGLAALIMHGSCAEPSDHACNTGSIISACCQSLLVLDLPINSGGHPHRRCMHHRGTVTVTCFRTGHKAAAHNRVAQSH